MEACFETDMESGCMELLFGTDTEMNEGYCIRIEPHRNRMVFDRWPRTAEHAFEPGLERPIARPENGQYRCTLFVDGNAGCVYVNDEVSLSFRMYSKAGNCWGAAVESGSATITTSR